MLIGVGFIAERGTQGEKDFTFPAKSFSSLRVPPSAWYQALVSFDFITGELGEKIQKVPCNKKRENFFSLPEKGLMKSWEEFLSGDRS
jgi:hypothetical protein